MKYSIIVAVYNRLGEVKELLASVDKLDFKTSNFEIVFVDDGSKDGFKEFIENYQQSSRIQIQVVFQENQGPGAARNYGMKVAKGDYFIFVDSDCILPNHWLKEIDTKLKAEAIDAFGGPDAAHPSFSPLVKAINYSMTSFIGTGGTRGNSKSIAKFYPRSFNMGISRKVYNKIGGMGDLRHGQDMDYSARIYQNGFNVALIPNAYVYHKRRTSLKKFFKQVFNWGVARINLATQHKNMLKPVHTLPALIVVLYFVLGVFSAFNTTFSSIFLLFVLGHIMVTTFAFFQALFQYKKPLVAFYAMLTLNIQVFAYGLGLLSAFFQKILGKKEAKGFTKNYYGKKS